MAEAVSRKTDHVMTYLGPKSERQFMVIATGGGGSFSEVVSDILAAYVLAD
jgi:glucose dehydrogenase